MKQSLDFLNIPCRDAPWISLNEIISTTDNYFLLTAKGYVNCVKGSVFLFIDDVNRHVFVANKLPGFDDTYAPSSGFPTYGRTSRYGSITGVAEYGSRYPRSRVNPQLIAHQQKLFDLTKPQETPGEIYIPKAPKNCLVQALDQASPSRVIRLSGLILRWNDERLTISTSYSTR